MLALVCSITKAQVYNMTCPPSPQTINSCTGTFYDAGGSAANYPNNQNFCTYTFCSNSPGECLMLNFTSFNVNDIDIFGNVYDYLTVYDGPSTASPLLFYIYGGPFPAPFPVAAAGSCLTFEFYSDGSIRTSGWSAVLNCQPCPIPTSPSQQDCNGAIPICQEQYYQPYSYVGNNGSDIIPLTSCLLDGELNSSWYIFTPQTSGPLSFILSPNYTNDDYDWAVYDISSNGCAGITNGTSPEISCNYSADVTTWAAQTGAFSGAPYNGTLNSQGSFGTPFNASPNVVAGNTYVLVVSNFSSTQGGYYLDLAPSTANLFDNIAPVMESVNTVLCGANTITVNFSEPILCSSIQSTDFSITGGPPTSVTAAVGVSCGGAGTYTQSVILTVNPAFAGGTFNVNLVGSITDLCGNLATGTLSFGLSTVSNAGIDISLCGLSTNLAGNTPAAGSGLWTQISSSTGGTTIFTNNSSPNSLINVSQAGVYTYQWTITNGACVVSDQVVITFGPPPVATFTYPTPICYNASNPLPTFTGGGIAGVFSASPAGLNFVNTSTGEINLASTTAGTYTITNTIAAVGGCPTVTATFVIVINTAVALSITPNPASSTTCTGISTVTLTVTPNTFPSYTWAPATGLSGTVGFSVAANPLVATTYTVIGTAANGCTSSTSILVNVSTPSNAGTNGTITICSDGAPVDLFNSLLGTPQSTGSWSGPSVLGGGNLGTFSPGVSVAGVYTYTVAGTAPCPNASATVTVTQNTAPNAGSSSSITLCSNSSVISLFSLLGGTPQSTGSWTGPSVLPGGNLGNFDPAVHSGGVYTYNVSATAPCINATASITVTLNAFTSTNITYPGSPFCTNYVGSVSPVINGVAGGTFSSLPAGLSINGVGDITPSSSSPGVYTITYLVPASGGCPSYSVSQTVVINAFPTPPTLIPNPACSGIPVTFTAGGGTAYEFTLNGVSQGAPSTSNSITLGPLNAGEQVCVKSYPTLPISFDGLIMEPEWGSPISTSTGGPASSGFGLNNNLDALYLKNSNGYFYGALAGNVVNGSNNRILLFIDCQVGGFNNLAGWVSRSNAPYYSVENLNNITFDAGFSPEYILAMNQAGGNSFFDLYNMVTNTNNFLGDGIASPWLGFVPNAGVGDFTKGFEFGFPMAAIGNPSVSIQVFAMLVNNPGTQTLPNTTFSNQFLTPCGSAEINYGNGVLNFGSAIPNPIQYPLSTDCFSQTCVNISNSITPTFSFPTSICSGAVAPILPLVSDNGINGTWVPAVINNTTGSSYTFTPSGGCAVPVTINVSVVPNPTLSPLFHD